jgi:hypothetical protein
MSRARRHIGTASSYRTGVGVIVLLAAIACGGATGTAPAPTRYNFAVIDGKNQSSRAGDATLAKPITAELTRDPQGRFATRVFDLLAPTVAYAQGLSLAGDPVANAIVCGRVAPVGEPQVVPLCAYTLADGKAANVVQGGTKAGTYTVLFTAQVPTQEPVVDSTTVTVEAGPAAPDLHVSGPILTLPTDTIPANAVRDIYGNPVPFRIQGDSLITVAGNVVGTVDARRFSFKPPTNVIGNVHTPILDGNGVQIATLDYTLYVGSTSQWTWQTWGMQNAPH